jgi:RNA polymerase sigma-70 factor, ECF subfamily
MSVEDCESTIARVLRRFTLQEADRDDCRQAVWEAILSSGCARFRGGVPAAWLAALARNKAIDFLRRNRRSPHVGLVPDLPETAKGDAEQDRARSRAVIWPALGRLEACSDPRSFLIFFLHWIEGWSIRDAGQAVGLDQGPARQRHHRLMIKFREIVQADPDGIDPQMSAGGAP